MADLALKTSETCVGGQAEPRQVVHWQYLTDFRFSSANGQVNQSISFQDLHREPPLAKELGAHPYHIRIQLGAGH